MSFDVSLSKSPCGCCGRPFPALFEFNLTHNVNDMVDDCLRVFGDVTAKRASGAYRNRSWGRLDGWTGREAVPVLEAASKAAFLPSNEDRLRALEPSNGWGSLVDVRASLSGLLAACREHSDALISACG